MLDSESDANNKVREIYQYKSCQNIMNKLKMNMAEFFNKHTGLTF